MSHSNLTRGQVIEIEFGVDFGDPQDKHRTYAAEPSRSTAQNKPENPVAVVALC